MASRIDEENNKTKMSQEERDRLMQEFLYKGGQINKLRPGIARGAASLNRSKNLQLTQKDLLKQEIKE